MNELAMSEDCIVVNYEGPVAIVTLNRPAQRNAFSRELSRALADALHDVMISSARARAIVLTGAGGHFSASADQTPMTQHSIGESRELVAEACAIVCEMAAGPKPVIAAVEGVAFGAGLSLAAAADYLVCASDARFCADFVRLGLIPELGAMWTLPNRVGMSKARELLSLASEIDGREALRIGLAHRVVEPGRTLPAAVELASELAQHPPLAIALIKSALTSRAHTMDAALLTEIDYQAMLRQSRDILEPARRAAQRQDRSHGF